MQTRAEKILDDARERLWDTYGPATISTSPAHDAWGVLMGARNYVRACLIRGDEDYPERILRLAWPMGAHRASEKLNEWTETRAILHSVKHDPITG